MKYTKEIVDKIVKLYEEGILIDDICAYVGISKDCFYRWKNNKNDFYDLLKSSKDKRDNSLNDMVLNCAYKTAVGYEYKETTQIKRLNEDGKMIIVEEKTTTKQAQPNVTSIYNILCNRLPNEWQSINKDKIVDNTSNEIIDKLIDRLATNKHI
jgi:hypothetical protein